MGHCRDCTWYEPLESFVEDGELVMFDCGKCVLLSDWPSLTEAEPVELIEAKSKRLAEARDTEQYHAWLDVLPDFGCIHFTAKH